MDFWKLIEEGRNHYKQGMLTDADKCFNEARQLRKDAKYIIDIIHFTKNFKTTDLDLNDCISLDVQEYRLNIKSIIILKDTGEIEGDIYEYIAQHMSGFEEMEKLLR